MQQSDHVSLILEGIADNMWAVPLATAMCSSVQELISHAMPLDTIRKLSGTAVNTYYATSKGEEPQKETKQIHRFNPTVNRKEDQICFKCKSKGHISYECKSDKINTKEKSNWSQKNKSTTDNHYLKSENHSNKDTNSKNKSINCIQNFDYALTPKVSQIPVTINGSITIDALPDNDGSYATPDGDCTPCGWISLRVQVGKIDYTMPKVSLCEALPIAMILGRDWQSAVHATIIIEPNGAICITTPTSTQEFGCVKVSSSFVGCVVESRFSSKPLVSKSDEIIVQPIKDKESKQISDTYLTIEQNDQLQGLLSCYEDIFSNPAAEIGKFPNLEMEINLTEHKPFRCKPYRVTEPDRIFIREQVDKWIANQVCRHSNSPYGAPAFVIEQPFHVSTPKRVVIDYSRTINPVTIKDPFPIDQMDDMIKKLAGKKYISIVDIKQAFNNIRIKEEDVYKTALVTPDHHIEFTRVIFGLANAPAILARAVSEVYGHLQTIGLAKYYDDIGGGHDVFEDHLDFLHKHFEATRKHKLKFTRQKCNFAVQKIKLLGRILDEDGDHPDPNKIKSVQRYETLDSIHEVRSFLEFANTLRRYIKNFAVISRPLSNILKKSCTDLKKSRNQPVTLNQEQQEAFFKMKLTLTSPPYEGIGACLSQIQDGETRIIEYASRTLKDAEKKYHSNELEVTAVHWAITEKFRLYLTGKKFKLLTDSLLLTQLLILSGKLNNIADHLSRYPQPDINENHLCLAVIQMQNNKLELAQKADAYCQQIAKKLENNINNLHIQQIKLFYKYDNGILVHVNSEYGHKMSKIVIPFSCRSIVLKSCHDNAGHFDAKKTLEKLRTRFWWNSMRKDTKLYVRADHLSLPPTKSGNCYILAHICHATRFLVAKPTCTTATDDVINTVENDIINQYGPPLTYISDNGSSFTSAKFQQFLEKYGIEHLLSPPYPPHSNALIERSNATLIAVLSKYTLEYPNEWDEKLPNLILAINTIQQSSSKYSPFYLLHGYEPRIISSELNLSTILSEITRELHSVGKVCYKIKKLDQSDSKKKDTTVVQIQSLKPFLSRPNLDDPGTISFEDYTEAGDEPNVEISANPESEDKGPKISSHGRVIKKSKWLGDYVTE
ncbi:Transposon Ty3-G Gag-Pol polyprotein, partial [Aphis craccivora]